MPPRAELDGYHQHFQATVHFPLTSAIEQNSARLVFFLLKKFRERRESNPRLQGKNQVCYLCAILPPPPPSVPYPSNKKTLIDPKSLSTSDWNQMTKIFDFVLISCLSFRESFVGTETETRSNSKKRFKQLNQSFKKGSSQSCDDASKKDGTTTSGLLQHLKN